MAGSNRKGRLIVILVSVFLITMAHFLTPPHMAFFHNVYQRLYYLPILAAAFWFGVRGAMAVAILSAASYLPHIMTDWAGHPEYRQAQYAELILFQVVGLVVGGLAQSEKRQREKQERTAEELKRAYQKLRESFEQLRRADRLSALGQLSAGLAHEIKNPLASMKGSLEILASEFPPGHDKREFAEMLERELNRLNGVLSEFLQFARPPKPDRGPCRVRDVLDSIEVLCSQEAARRRVTIGVDCPAELPEVELDAAQIQQALLNVVLNGIQAMPDGGRLTMTARANGKELDITVRDEGVGIPEENRSRIFDPFFTTKEKGTGLGMAIAHNLIQGHGGDIQIVDEPGQGSTFRIVLPLKSRG